MLNLDELRAVKTIVSHGGDRPCPDGVASALLLRDALPGAAVRFVQYGPELLALDPEPGMIFCDIAPAPERAAEFVAAGAIVLGHHKTDKEVVALFGERGVYADEPFVSGVVLAHREVWMPLKFHSTSIGGQAAASWLARTAGVRDTWQKGSVAWQVSCEQAAALAFFPWEMWPEVPFGEHAQVFDRMLSTGATLFAKQKADAERHVSRLYRTTLPDGTRIGIMPSLETSDVAELAGDSLDLLVGFAYKAEPGVKPHLVLSTRSRGTFDCAAFCAANGGGGHTSAAGLDFAISAEDQNPYNEILSMLYLWQEYGCSLVAAP